MITITNHKNNTIYYSCNCGAKGMCSFKPLKRESPIVLDIKCPVCQDTERVLLLQYKNEDNKKKILGNIENEDISWVPFINEEILDDKEE